ncbi:MAG: signal peptide peptidase SppA, partial [Candidatus Krumholzibacteriota bacterium]|nr:signal peptide peptidase SppA [Candidatus Krumholzibacteriota bacterium]
MTEKGTKRMSCRFSRTRTLFAAAVLLLGVARVSAGGFSEIPSYYTHLSFNLTSPTAYTTAVGGFANPAVYALMPGPEIEAYFADPNDNPTGGLSRWGLFTGLGKIGFGFQHERAPDNGTTVSVTDYRLAISGGSRDKTLGASVGWSRGDEDAFQRTTVIQLGYAQRINRKVSIGLSGIFSTEKSDQAGLFDVAYRPLGDGRVTVFGDLEYAKGYSLKNAPWSAGAMLEIPAGVKFIGRYYEREAFSLALAYTFGAGKGGGRLRASAEPFYNDSARHVGTNWGVRMGYAEENGLMKRRTRNSRYVGFELKGPVRHTRFRYFDRSITFTRILAALEGARTDERVAGVAINFSGMRISRGNAWELREKLAELQRDGKHVVVFIDEAGMTQYHLASVADRVIMDPQGLLVLPGYAMGRTYLTTLIDRMGLGVEEFRFKDYKSALESVTRHDMSPEDREQRQALIDEYYNTMREEVSASRGIEESTFDEWVNDLTIILPQTALHEGLVDTLARWSAVGKVIADLEGSAKKLIGPRSVAKLAYPSKAWGEPPRIAVVYALGVCAMDKGIRARELEATFRRLAADRRVKGVVLRVNSPGGSPMASDVVAGAMRACGMRKPVIVSQGDVAASGGYWISMYGHEIVAQPTTITGSIGVISGWTWDNGIGEKLGLESDFVKAGEHADIYVNIRLPFLPIGIPYRRLTDDERERLLVEMERMYDTFVAKVAEGREMEPVAVEALAKGRVWTGTQALDNGLVDRIGGIETAIALARERAGIDEGEEVKIVEYGGTRGFFDPKLFRPRLVLLDFFGMSSQGSEESDGLGFLYGSDLFYLE